MILLECPFLKQPVRMSQERQTHVLDDHPHMAASWPSMVQEVLMRPDEIRWSHRRASTLVFGRWYPLLLGGKYVLVVVVLDATGKQEPWIVTAYVARHWRMGDVAWRAS
jgi:hypothetical protein